MESKYRKMGWFLIDAEFPEAFVLLASTKLKPAPIVAAVVLNFTDYDVQPPSVKFVNPFTREPLAMKDLGFVMARRPIIPGTTPAAVAIMLQQGTVQAANMIQANTLDEVPFLCMPGVREYHDNPAHTGDSWLLHRTSGEGSLAFILDKIWTYGVNPVGFYQVQIQTQGIGLAIPNNAIPE